MSSPGEFVPTKSWVRNLLVKNFVIFSHEILDMTSPEKKNFAIFNLKIVGTSSPLENLCHF
jgi:hypothetical protein